MIRMGQKNIIFLINNGGYTIEVEIHDGPYNVIKNWNYTALVDAMHNGEGNCWTAKVFFGSNSVCCDTLTRERKMIMSCEELLMLSSTFWCRFVRKRSSRRQSQLQQGTRGIACAS